MVLAVSLPSDCAWEKSVLSVSRVNDLFVTSTADTCVAPHCSTFLCRLGLGAGITTSQIKPSYSRCSARSSEVTVGKMPLHVPDRPFFSTVQILLSTLGQTQTWFCMLRGSCTSEQEPFCKGGRSSTHPTPELPSLSWGLRKPESKPPQLSPFPQ